MGIKYVGFNEESEINPPMLERHGLRLPENMVWGFLKNMAFSRSVWLIYGNSLKYWGY